MKLIWISWCGALAVLTSAVAQNTDQQDLPSAPSAVQEQQKQPSRSAPATARSPASQSSSIQELKPIGQEPAPPPPAPPPESKPANPAPEEQATPSATPPPLDTKPSAPSDSADSSDADSALTIRKTVNEVNVVFVVTDKHGHYVKDLKKDDFRVLDDNKPAKEIRSFRNETDLPLQVGLLVDASNSVRDRFKFEQEAAIEFLNQIIRPGYDKAFVIGFDTTPEVTQDFTDNTELLSRGVRALRAGGGTAMYDALYFACRDKLKNAPRKGPVRRAIILLSDGEDNQSRVTREEAIEMAQRAEVIVYTISTNVSGAKRQGDKILERIADATGGRAFFPFQLRDVSNDFAEIQNELRSQYALAYIPDDFRSDGRFRTIQITADQKSFHVRSRRGYYAPAQ
ncbi:MAG TPA: VWA domain-containing protein [Terriglobales bacterium]|nr:VWA domain-containing protein [Terriglobales bacterium]